MLLIFCAASEAPVPIFTLDLLPASIFTSRLSSEPEAIFMAEDNSTLLISFQKWLLVFPFKPAFPNKSTPCILSSTRVDPFGNTSLCHINKTLFCPYVILLSYFPTIFVPIGIKIYFPVR